MNEWIPLVERLCSLWREHHCSLVFSDIFYPVGLCDEAEAHESHEDDTQGLVYAGGKKTADFGMGRIDEFCTVFSFVDADSHI